MSNADVPAPVPALDSGPGSGSARTLPAPADVPEPPHGETIASRRGFDGALLHVRVDTVRLPSGRERPREVVEHPGAVAIVPVTADGRVLLLRQFHHAIGRSLLGIPAGTIDAGEAPAQTAARELVEETGHAAASLRPIASYFTSPGYTDERMTLFLADGCAPVAGAANPDELIALAAVPLADVPALIAAGPDRLHDAKTLVGLLLLLRGDG